MSSATNVRTSRDTDRWEIEIRADIPTESLQMYRAEAIKEIQKTAKLDGFRPGHAPEEAIVRVYGETEVMRRAAELAVKSELPELLAKEQANIVEAPRVSIEPPESGKPLAFSARAPLAPEITLPDYKKIAKSHADAKVDVVVTDEEHGETLTHLRREKARIERIEKGVEPAKAYEEAAALDASGLPELDDEFVKSLGYENAEVFSQKVRENIKNEKELREAEKRRAAMLDELAAQSTIRYPALLREYELDDMEARIQGDLERMGRTLEQYLTDTKKTREELRAEWKEAADKRARVRLILGEIARKENIQPDEARLAHELEHAKQHYPQANVDTLRAHIAHALRNEQVIRFLEGNPEPAGHTAADHAHT
ncbi:hypothetical protein COU20_03045 [Candidatus Kaiserbacteria bacterium CG10_big_fil_rev_8_21_14_0_10_59_10]|uniref:Trigger factor n=1 Tax=Candidatus Kaiserbacteria bacterium CG10_big_fil_rev_8_21_14_0_10_59_10 TaxID=1974612 RepID=A0A2H0U7C0_9BACT|nr:MAG: hypothetical protein COU20_03045 [Candidatus Kaiserbacteria bacterium CG10_big_fil_rev_8_21_14_0_10_59_10]